MKKIVKVIIVGGGPAGMLAGISAARSGNEVVILEKMNIDLLPKYMINMLKKKFIVI